MPYDGTDTGPALLQAPANFKSNVRRIVALLMPSRAFEHAVTRLLHQARSRIEKPEYWCQGHYAINTGGVCLLAALRHAARYGDPEVLRRARHELLSTAQGIAFSTVELMNDGLQHQQLLSSIDEALHNLRPAQNPHATAAPKSTSNSGQTMNSSSSLRTISLH